MARSAETASGAHDPTTDPSRGSWVPGADDSDFPVQNLPYGVLAPPDGPPRVMVAIGPSALDLARVAAAGLLDGAAADAARLFAEPSLDPLLAAGPDVWRTVRERLADLLTTGHTELARAGLAQDALLPRDTLRPCVPCTVGDVVDFYACEHHATNVGRIFRPDEPLLPNWRHLPVGYHGRSAAIVPSGTGVRRPWGQLPPSEPGGMPTFAPTARLDFELEVAFVTGAGPGLGTPIPVEEAGQLIFGMLLLDDWSARDVQAWEYRPLGPFLGKSFATTVSPWVVPMAALAPYRTDGPVQDPPVLAHLRHRGERAIDIHLEAAIAPAGGAETAVTRTSARHCYWSPEQQLAHATSNGARVRPGDLFASGTVSGPDPGSEGCLLERTRDGAEPLTLTGGARRGYLEDGDTVVLRGWCGGDGRPRVGFGEARGTILPALPSSRPR